MTLAETAAAEYAPNDYSERLDFTAGFTAGLRQAALIARAHTDNEPDGYYGQACSEVAAAILKEVK